MHIGKPSPAMVVAVIALVFAMTGTGLAARGLINGRDVKDRSLTGADIADGSITARQIKNRSISSADLGKDSVTSAAIADRSVAASDLRQAPAPNIQTMCWNGTVAIGVPCPAMPPPGTGPAGATGPAGTSGKDAGVATTNRITVPGGATSTRFASITGTGTAGPDFNAVMTATPDAGTQVRDVSVQMVAPPAAKYPTSIVVVLAVLDGTPQGTGGACTFDPSVTDKCTFKGPITVAANSKIAWVVQTIQTKLTPPENGAYDQYELSLGFRSTVAE